MCGVNPQHKKTTCGTLESKNSTRCRPIHVLTTKGDITAKIVEERAFASMAGGSQDAANAEAAPSAPMAERSRPARNAEAAPSARMAVSSQNAGNAEAAPSAPTAGRSQDAGSVKVPRFAHITG